MDQGLQDHLTIEYAKIEKDKDVWLKADELLCSVLWQSIDPSLHLILQIVIICGCRLRFYDKIQCL